MKLVILTGFLGSGKTTLLLKLVKELVSGRDSNLVVLENEVGEVGIDGAYLEARGLNVRELYSGCVCCQLAGSLVTTLKELKEAIDPECVFLETSGLARLDNILDVIRKYCDVVSVEEILMISLFDIDRSGILLESSIPVVINQIQMADIVALNKVDLSETREIEAATAELKKINADAEIIPMSAFEGENLAPILDRLREWI